MKYCPLLLIFMLGFSSIALAQEAEKNVDFQLGFGPSLSIPYKNTIEVMPELERNPRTDYFPRMGYFFDASLSLHLNKHYAIQTGLNYHLSSIKINDRVGFYESEGQITNTCLSLPLLLKFRISQKIPLSVSAGLYFSILLAANESGTAFIDTAAFVSFMPDPLIESIEPVSKYNSDIKKYYEPVDFGLSLQIDYEFWTKKAIAGVLFTRINYGLKDVLTNEPNNRNTASQWKNYSVMLGFGVKL